MIGLFLSRNAVLIALIVGMLATFWSFSRAKIEQGRQEERVRIEEAADRNAELALEERRIVETLPSGLLFDRHRRD